MFTVKTVSGFEMILEDAGQDSEGNQLWRQVKVGLGPSRKRQELANTQRLRCRCGHKVADHRGNYNGSRACDHCSCPGYPKDR
jgi:hypothetical protein